MKKFRLLLALPLLSASLFSSACSFNSKIKLIYGDLHIETYVDLPYLDLQSKISNEETFMLAVEPTSACSCWSDFRAILNEYIPENHVIVYHMKYENFYNQETYGLNLRNGYTTFAIFESGKLKQNLISDNQKIFHDADAFEEYMENTVELPHYIYVNLDDVKEIRSGNKPTMIYFARSNCPDCSYVDKYFLKEYAERRPIRQDMFILDCESLGIREYDEQGHLTPESAIAWQAFKDEMGLSTVNNEHFGYSTGFVPTFLIVHSSRGEISYDTGAVYFNDSIALEDGKYIVKDSYYTEERLPDLEHLTNFAGTKVLKGLEIPLEDIEQHGEYYAWKQEAAAKYHSPLLKQFLNYWL